MKRVFIEIKVRFLFLFIFTSSVFILAAVLFIQIIRLLHMNQVEIQPAERETIFSDELRPSDPRNVGPCGGFSTQYMYVYHNVQLDGAYPNRF